MSLRQRDQRELIQPIGHALRDVERAIDRDTEIEELARENERLREALRKIRGMKPEPIGDTGLVVGPLSLFNACQRIARAALKEK